MIFSSLEFENRLKKHVRNVARIKYGLVGLVVILFTSKEQKGRFLSMSLDTLDASLLGNLLTGKEAKKPNITGRERLEAFTT